MTDREPVNIMGVIAFPNPNKDERMIRFIAVSYTHLQKVTATTPSQTAFHRVFQLLAQTAHVRFHR